jgi:DNA-binding protein HU-beta
MTKAELVAQIAKDTGLSKADSAKALASFIATVAKTLKKDGRVPIFGLGVYTVVKKPKRHGRNPRTGEPLIIKARKAIKFKPAKRLTDSLNNGNSPQRAHILRRLAQLGGSPSDIGNFNLIKPKIPKRIFS